MSSSTRRAAPSRRDRSNAKRNAMQSPPLPRPSPSPPPRPHPLRAEQSGTRRRRVEKCRSTRIAIDLQVTRTLINSTCLRVSLLASRTARRGACSERASRCGDAMNCGAEASSGKRAGTVLHMYCICARLQLYVTDRIRFDSTRHPMVSGNGSCWRLVRKSRQVSHNSINARTAHSIVLCTTAE